MSFEVPVREGEHSSRVRGAQRSLTERGNRFKKDYQPGLLDGTWEGRSIAAANGARYDLGYPIAVCYSRIYGQRLYDYLRVDGKGKKLPLVYQARRIARWGRRLVFNSRMGY